MNNAEFQLRGVGDPRLAVHATSALPAWLWSVDGTRILWANPVGASMFGAANGAALAEKIFGPADAHRRQVARLAGKLPPAGAIRLERLRGFGAPLGRLVTCGCARLDFADGHHGILIAAAEMVGRTMPLFERLQRLVEGIDTPIAAFTRDGMFIGASDAARPLLGFRNLTEAGLDEARNDALKHGRVETPVGIGHMVLQRVGAGADVGLVALLIAPDTTQGANINDNVPASPQAAAAEPSPQEVAPMAERPTPDYEQPAVSGEAPAEFALIDEFTEARAEPAAEHRATEAPPEPDLMTVLQLNLPHAEASAAAAASDASDLETHPDRPPPDEPPPHEPSLYVEAVADEPAPASPVAVEGLTSPSIAPPGPKMPSWLDEPAPNTRRHPLRFMWQMDAEARFSLGSDEFARLIGARTAAGFGRLWSEIAEVFGLDPDGRVLKAVATRDTWSGITLNWPVDGGGRLPVELSGLPVYDRSRNFAGYRGFGVCRDLDGLTRLAALCRFELFSDPPTPTRLSADIVQADSAQDKPAADLPAVPSASTPESLNPIAVETSHQTDLETQVETPKETLKNVLPFRPPGEAKSPVLTPVENNAFAELARQLAARLEGETGTAAATPAMSEAPDAAIEQPAAPETSKQTSQAPEWLEGHIA